MKMIKKPTRFDRLYSPSEVAELANVSIRTVYRWLHSGYLPAHKIGTGETWSITELDLDALLTGKLRGRKVVKVSDVTERPIQSAGPSQLKPMEQKKRRR